MCLAAGLFIEFLIGTLLGDGGGATPFVVSLFWGCMGVTLELSIAQGRTEQISWAYPHNTTLVTKLRCCKAR